MTENITKQTQPFAYQLIELK